MLYEINTTSLVWTEVNGMPNIKSAIKRVKTAETRNSRNASQRSAMRTAIKKFDEAFCKQRGQRERSLRRSIEKIR